MEGNLESTIEVTFPRQSLRFFRLRFIPDSQCCREGQNTAFARYAVSELEVYGRGVVPEVRWESKVIDLGQTVTLARSLRRQHLAQGHSRVRTRTRNPKRPLRSGWPCAPAWTTNRWPTTPTMTCASLPEVSATDYARLKPRRWPFDPLAAGWAGPITEDRDNWSFWSPPLEHSGEKPGCRAAALSYCG